jgi:hypothetical protein
MTLTSSNSILYTSLSDAVQRVMWMDVEREHGYGALYYYIKGKLMREGPGAMHCEIRRGGLISGDELNR